MFDWLLEMLPQLHWPLKRREGMDDEVLVLSFLYPGRQSSWVLLVREWYHRGTITYARIEWEFWPKLFKNRWMRKVKNRETRSERPEKTTKDRKTELPSGKRLKSILTSANQENDRSYDF